MRCQFAGLTFDLPETRISADFREREGGEGKMMGGQNDMFADVDAVIAWARVMRLDRYLVK
jgi:hypothetical protein